MCEARDPAKALRGVPFKIASLAQSLERGSYERSLAESVYDSVRKDIEYAIRQLGLDHMDKAGEEAEA